ncbi:MAG: right-handed parallel beta-helix repeat-containing protein [Pseudomonadota bacterium]
MKRLLLIMLVMLTPAVAWAWSNQWNLSTPAGTESPVLGDDRIREMKVALHERLNREHTLSEGTEDDDSGKHKPGSAGVCFSGDTAAIDALETGHEGAIAWDTGSGLLKRSTGSAWEALLHKDSVSVTEFGAIPDDDLSDQAAFVAAAAAAAGRKLIVPKGQYEITGWTPGVKCDIELEPGAILHLMDGSNASVVTLSVAGSSIRGGKIVNNSAGQSSNYRAGVRITADDCTVDGVEISDTFTSIRMYGIWAINCNNPRIINNKVTGTGYCSIFYEVTDSIPRDGGVISRNLVDRSSLDPDALVEGGLKIHGYGLISGVKLSDNTVKMPLDSAEPEVINGACICVEIWALNSTMSGGYCYGGSMAVSVAGTHVDVTGVSAYGPALYGYEIAVASYCTLSGCSLDGAGICDTGVGISNHDTEHNSVVGNSIKGCRSRGISLGTNGANNYETISGNSIDITGGYGLEIVASSYITCTGNVLNGNGTATKAIVLNACSDVCLTGNQAYNFSQHGVAMYSTGTNLNSLVIVGNDFKTCNVAIGTDFSGGAALGTSIRVAENGGVEYGSTSTLSGDVTLTVLSAHVKTFDPGGTSRDVTPSGAFPTGFQFTIVNTADGYEHLTFDPSGLNLNVNQNEQGIFIYDGTAWRAVFVGA